MQVVSNLYEIANPVFWGNKKNISICLLKFLSRVLWLQERSATIKWQREIMCTIGRMHIEADDGLVFYVPFNILKSNRDNGRAIMKGSVL